VRKRYRSAVSRAYYAVFAALTHRLRSIGLTPPPGREAWAHRTLPRLFVVHLCRDRSRSEWNELLSRLGAAYRDRLNADYFTEAMFDERSARRRVADAVFVLRVLSVPE
jgi:uncharacterized protein (UPF0332 family)